MVSDVRAITIRLGTVAEEYERTHFIGHTDYNPDLIPEMFTAKAGEIADGIADRTGYIAFVRDIKVRHFPPKQTDVDFILDVPAKSPIAPIVIVAVIAVILVACAAITYIAWKWWTTWVEKVRKYVCDQCPDFPSFDGWDAYMGHLKGAHPDKYEGAIEAAKVGADNWWEAIVPIGIGVLLIFGALIVLPYIIPKRRE